MSLKKKNFEEYYERDTLYEPELPGFDNPSGMPTNIPPELLNGIEIKPAKPWVYLGP